MSAMAYKITSLKILYSTVYSDADQRKHQSSAPVALVRGIHRWPVNSPHKRLVTGEMFSFDDVIMDSCNSSLALIDFNWKFGEATLFQMAIVITNRSLLVI